MLLKQAHYASTASNVFDGDPDVQNRKNILYVPRTASVDKHFGLFEENGRLLLGNALFHGYPSSLKSQSLSSTAGDAKGHPEIDRAVYGGVIGLHYGHFITECLNTLWWFQRHGRSTDLILFHSSSTVEEVFQAPYAVAFFNLIGLRREQVVILSHTTRVRELIIPGPAFCEDSFAYRAFGRFCAWIGEQAERISSLRPDRPVFLSRNRLGGGTVRLENEDELFSILEAGGIDIVYPEEMSLYDQIALFRRSPLVTGLHGSAFHTSVFAPGVKGIAIALEPGIRRSFPLLDAVSGAEITYLYPVDLTPVTPSPGFYQTVRMANAKEVARELLERVKKTGDKSISSASRRALGTSSRGTAPGLQGVFQLRSKAGELLAAEQSSGWIYAKANVNGRFDPVIALRFGGLAVLMANSSVAPVIRIFEDGISAPTLAYDIVDTEGFVALYNSKIKRYLTSIPDTMNHPVACRAADIQDWEQFTLEPVENFVPRDRLALIFSWLQRELGSPLDSKISAEASSTIPQSLSFLRKVFDHFM